MLNSIDVDVDLVISLLTSNLNEQYRPLLNLEESDKANYLYLLVKVCLTIKYLFEISLF